MKWFPIFLVFFVPSVVMAYQSIITNSYEWAKQRSHRLFIDDSHNHIHSREVFNHFLDMRSREPILQERFPNYSEKFRCAALGCLLHDMMDKKYTDEEGAWRQIEDFLYSQKIDMSTISALEIFLSSMSYSKTVSNKEGKLYLHLPEKIRQHPLFDCFEMIRACDLISSYNLQRTILYNIKKFPEETPQEIYEYLKNLYSIRMGRLIEDEILPAWSISYAKTFHHKSCEKLTIMEKTLGTKFTTQQLFSLAHVYDIPEWDVVEQKMDSYCAKTNL